MGSLTCPTGITLGKELLLYSFPEGHPMGGDRLGLFVKSVEDNGSIRKELQRVEPRLATQEELLRFHTPAYVDEVKRRSERPTGYLDGGDTPAFEGMFEAASYTVGSTLRLLEGIAAGEFAHGFNPMGGLHHARRGSAAGFCIFNDIGVAIESAKSKLKLSPILYVDVDAHHGDGVYYSFEEDPDVMIIDLHEDGRYLYPGTGHSWEKGRGAAEGNKVNVELQPGCDDATFRKLFDKAFTQLAPTDPALVIMQCGADSIKGDPLAHLELTPESHGYVVRRLAELSHRKAGGRLLALGGGGYNPANAAGAWTAVLEGLVSHR